MELRRILGMIGCCAAFFCAASAFAQGYDTCASLHDWLFANPQPQDGRDAFKMQYDSLRLYIEHCGAKDDQCYIAFNSLDDDVQEYAPDDTNRYNIYRDWLISVLYVNTTNAYYFCRDLESVANTYGWGKYALPNAWFAVMNYVLHGSHCVDSGMQAFYNRQLKARHQTWLDGDTTKPEDTTLPSLDQLGLGFLLKNDVQPSLSPLASQYITSFSASENPFQDQTKLRFSLSRMGYITIDIFDELGRNIPGIGTGKIYETGSYEIVVDGSLLPSGTLYARISTGFGEVKTVKLVHEK